MKNIILQIVVLFLLGCSSAAPVTALSDPSFIVFQSSISNSSLCSGQIELNEKNGKIHTLISMNVSLTDSANQKKEKTYSQEELNTLFGSITVIPYSVVKGNLQLDVSGLTPPIQGNVLVVTVAEGVLGQFVGEFSCP